MLTDPSEGMLTEAKKRLDGVPPGRTTFLPAMGSEDLKLFGADAAPEVVSAVLCHHYLSREARKRAVRACRDILGRGGLFVVFENIDFGSVDINEIALTRWGRHQANSGRPAEEIEAHRSRFHTAYFPITVDEHLCLLREMGFRRVSVFWLSYMQAGFYGIK